MIKPYSRVLAGRALWMGVCVLTMLFSTAWWQQKQTPQIGDTVFRPTGRIAQVLAASNSLDAQNPEHPSENSKANMPCEGRSLAVLRVRLMSGLEWSQAQADARIAQAAQATDRWSGCSSFLQAFQWAITLAATPADTSSVSARTVEQQLSEDVTWTRHIPCFLGKENNQIVLLSGNPMNCGNPPQLKSLAALSRESSYRQLASGVAKASTLSAVTGKLSSTGSASLTLNAQLQDGFDLWTACLNNKTCVKVPALQRLRDVSVVIMDAQSGALLAAWCHGKACNKANATGPGALGATLLEAPPASTAKLLFALGLATHEQMDPQVLQKQIKTSGQNDGSVSKRNEWWERQAICDTQKGQRCFVPSQTRAISDAFGFNLNCQAKGPGCGRVGLVSADVPSLVPGLIGRLAIDTQTDRGVKMIDWEHYDRIRQGKQKPQGDAAYTATSRAIQAVIGAGDSRVSAMGLAVVPMQLWRLSQKMVPVIPSVMAPSASTLLPRPPEKWSTAALTVMGGMRKAVEPAEAGWQGAGTISAAFTHEMQKPCTGECGVWGKTGTVSQKDPGFAGTSLFSGLVDTRDLSKWRGDSDAEKSPRQVLSIGVIAIPEKGAPPLHAASHLAMAAVNQIMLPVRGP
ncbi:hypothetical protein [Limnohabitans sp. T6-20]|uniref:hypothetical protein n=1 Tax=Limnohabitans sp. T6-20 TaxID=1100725 RepID=UPI000D37A25D|nr:hypothetical protein [Limnohabitans sp. T6-20]PUE12542.1 hypothetical protein B9Z33_03185 [Limnohabitans sp. T6-20]